MAHGAITLDVTNSSNHTSGTRGADETYTLAGLGTSTLTASYTKTGVDLSAEGGSSNATLNYQIIYTSVGGNIVAGAGGRLGVDGGTSDFIEVGESITASITGSGEVSQAVFNNFQVYDIQTPTADAGFDIISDYNSTAHVGVTGLETNTYYTWQGNSATTITLTGNAGEFSFGNLGVRLSATPVVVPEPSSTALLGLGCLALMMRRRK